MLVNFTFKNIDFLARFVSSFSFFLSLELVEGKDGPREKICLWLHSRFPDFFRNKIDNVVVVVAVVDVDVDVVVVVDVGLMGFGIKEWNRTFTVSLSVLEKFFLKFCSIQVTFLVQKLENTIYKLCQFCLNFAIVT